MFNIEKYTQVYYTVLYGNKLNCFADERDKKQLLNILKEVQSEKRIEIYAYCVTDNDIHLMLNIVNNRLSEVLDAIINKSNAYFSENYKPDWVVFKSEQKKEQVSDMKNILRCCRYIHQVPIEEKLVTAVEDYWWSSYWAYRKERLNQVVNSYFLLSTFDTDLKKATRKFVDFHKSEEQRILV